MTDLFKLSKWHLEQIESKCLVQGHLVVGDFLLDRIKTDYDTLNKYSVTKQQLWTAYNNTVLVYNSRTQNDQIPTETDKVDYTYDVLLDNEEVKQIHLQIRKCKYSDDEFCPITKYLEPHKPRERDNTVYKVKNVDLDEEIKLNDVVMRQIRQYGFFHSPASYYRIDPEKFIRIFGLNFINSTYSVEPLETKTVIEWGYPYSRFSDTAVNSKIWSKTFIVKNEQETPRYHAFVITTPNDKREQLLISFNSDVADEVNTKEKLKVFGFNLNTEWIIDCNMYYMCKKTTVYKLVDDDVEDEVKPVTSTSTSESTSRCVIC